VFLDSSAALVAQIVLFAILRTRSVGVQEPLRPIGVP